MNKHLKRVLIILFTISILAIFILILKLGSRLPENPSDYTGNTAGNLYNHGLFAEDASHIYFANPADNFRLYRMDHSLENVECINTDSVEYLNPDATSSYLYYSRINYRKNTYGNTVFDILDTGIYRLNLKNKGLTRLYPDACGSVLLGGNTLFYQSYGEDGNFDLESLSVLDNDAKSKLLSTSYNTPVNYTNGLLYYADLQNDNYLYSLNPENGSTVPVSDIECYQPIVTSQGTYYLSLKHNYALLFLPNGSDEATLITGSPVSAYNLSSNGRYLFYQVDLKRSSRLCKYDIVTGTETELMSGSFKNLNTVSDYLFFTDFAETTCYCHDITSGTTFSFMPLPEDSQ